MSLYSCHSCMDNIPLHKPRLQCTDCRFYNVCASCYVLGAYTSPHISTHRVIVIEKSGVIQLPPPPPPRPPLPPRKSTSASPSQSTAYISSQQPTRKPLQHGSPLGSPSVGSPSTQQENPAHVREQMNEAAGMPQTSPQSTDLQDGAQSRGWSPLFQGSEPSALGNQFFDALFNCLDAQRTGAITPEQYSAFLDVQGYLPEENYWKRMNKAQFGYNSEDLADYEFRTILENFSFEFTLRPRPTTPNNDMQNLLGGIPGLTSSFSKMLSSSINMPPLSGGQMPCLTRKGFIDICTVEMLAKPSLGWRYINLVAKHYNIWREWGDYPRSLLPEEGPKQVLDRIARVTIISQQRANERIEAQRVQLEIQKQGRDNASRLLDPPGTRYYYQY